jgi:hypothetical protein
VHLAPIRQSADSEQLDEKSTSVSPEQAAANTIPTPSKSDEAVRGMPMSPSGASGVPDPLLREKCPFRPTGVAMPNVTPVHLRGGRAFSSANKIHSHQNPKLVGIAMVFAGLCRAACLCAVVDT